ncbi:MAG: ADP-forming succinate--CoA ligase subunit beta [Thermosphaera sp.]
MKLYEYESKEIARNYGVPVPRGKVVSTPEEVLKVAEELGPVVLKSQVLVGGRGLAGGVLKAETPGEAYEKAKSLLGREIKGEKVEKLLVEEKVCISREYYVSITVDRASRQAVYLVSSMGGVEIEELAGRHPDMIKKMPVSPMVGYTSYMSREATVFMGLPWELSASVDKILSAMYKIMADYSAELVEFNPLALTCDGKLVALDAKIIVDDNSLFKHPELQPLFGRGLSSFERKAKELEFNYVELDGDIGVISNGAGLTMATMDAILYYGGRPANFLDIGGGAGRDRVKEAVKLLLSHPKVKVLLVNIFGGITRCDEVARGIVDALAETGVSKTIVVRMLGTNEEEGRKILAEKGITAYSEMDEAVSKAVSYARGGE